MGKDLINSGQYKDALDVINRARELGDYRFDGDLLMLLLQLAEKCNLLTPHGDSLRIVFVENLNLRKDFPSFLVTKPLSPSKQLAELPFSLPACDDRGDAIAYHVDLNIIAISWRASALSAVCSVVRLYDTLSWRLLKTIHVSRELGYSSTVRSPRQHVDVTSLSFCQRNRDVLIVAGVVASGRSEVFFWSLSRSCVLTYIATSGTVTGIRPHQADILVTLFTTNESEAKSDRVCIFLDWPVITIGQTIDDASRMENLQQYDRMSVQGTATTSTSHIPSISDLNNYKLISQEILSSHHRLTLEDILSGEDTFRKDYKLCEMSNTSIESTIVNRIWVKGSRGWMLDKLSAWFSSSSNSVFWLQGCPGTGKTATSAMFVHLHREKVAARIYLAKTSNASASFRAVGCIFSLTSQLVTHFGDDFKYNLLCSLHEYAKRVLLSPNPNHADCWGRWSRDLLDYPEKTIEAICARVEELCTIMELQLESNANSNDKILEDSAELMSLGDELQALVKLLSKVTLIPTHHLLDSRNMLVAVLEEIPLEHLLQICVIEPLRALDIPTSSSLILIDGVEHLVKNRTSDVIDNDILLLITNLTQKLPKWCKLMISACDTRSMRNVMNHVEPVIASLDVDPTGEDLMKIFEFLLSAKRTCCNLAVGAAILVDKAEGSMDYIRIVHRHLQKGMNRIALLKMPGLDEIHYENLVRVFGCESSSVSCNKTDLIFSSFDNN